jgi:peptidoglycan hydrolase-like protein with peptidoglycan-binding domain
VHSFRTSLALVLSAALAATPALAARGHHHASASAASPHAHGAHQASSKGSARVESNTSAKSDTKASRRAGRKSGAKAAKASTKSHQLHGQQSIASERVSQIQQALIREHYLTGEASGEWDSATLAAMQKFQSDPGWQTKLMPDSRALKKLGLGPDYSGAINAKEAHFSDPPPVSTLPPAVTAGFVAGSGASR